MLIVITGGPGSGKTTLIEALAARGFATVAESAIQVIGELSAELGLEEQKRWRSANRKAFQRRVLERQLELEARARAGSDEVVFLDRGCIDGLAYCRHFGEEPPPDLVRASREARYDRVFLLDTLAELPDRGATGRTSDRATSLVLRDRIDEVYRELGYEPTFVPLTSVEERTELVLGALGLAG